MIDFRLITQYIPDFIDALFETLKIALISGLISIIIGIVVGTISTHKKKYIQIPVNIYTGFIRSTPLLVQLYFIHFGLPLIGIILPSFQSATIAFSLNTGAYVSEIFRGGLESIDKGQNEASKALGLNWFQTMRFIIFPQVFKRVISPLINQFSYLIKDTSLAAVLVIPELTYMARKIAARTYKPIEAFGIPLLMYFGIYLILSTLSRLIGNKEKKKLRRA